MSRITRFILTLAVISLIGFIDLFAATAPSRQARYITFSNVTSNSVDITLVKGNGNNRVIVFSTDATIDAPTNGVDYSGADGTSGETIAVGIDGDVVYDNLTGSGWTSNITGLASGQTYYVQVFEYNEDGSNPITAFNTGTGTNNPRSFTTLVTVNPPTALTVDALTLTATTADLSWTAADPAPDGYIFSLLVDSQGEGSGNSAYDPTTEAVVQPFDELDISDDTEFDLTDLVGPSDYKYLLYSYIGNSNSSVVEYEFFTPQDNTPPQVSSITLTGETNNGGGLDNVIFEDDNGQDLTFTVTFNEAMKTWLTPTFSFNTPSPQGMSYVTGFWNPEGTVFTATINFDGADQESLDIDVTIGNAEDLAGNLISAGTHTASDVFSIDNISPSIDFIDYPGDACNKVGDEVEADITLTEVGYGTYDAADVVVKLINNTTSQEHIMTSSSFDATGATASNFTYTFQAGDDEGQYTIYVTTSDDAGNGPETDNNTSGPTLDKTPPIISNLQITGEDGTCLSDSDGDILEYTFLVVEDGCGTFDTNNVTVIITGPGESAPDNPNQSLVLTSGDGSVESPYLFTGSVEIDFDDADGDWNIEVFATDDAGNIASPLDPEDAEYNVDNTAPVFTAASVTAVCENGGDIVTLTFSVTEDGCGTFDGTNLLIEDDVTTEQAWTYVSGTGVGPYTYTLALVAGDPDGLVTVSINGTDAAGNPATPNTDATFTIDNTKPIIQNTAYDLTCVNGTDVVTLTFEVVEEGCGIFDENDISVDESPNLDESFGFISQTGLGTSGSPYVFTYSINIESVDPDGDVEVSINATDDAGNDADEVVNTGAFTIDNTAPVISNVAVDKTCVNGGTTVTLTFDVTEAGCGVFDNSLITISDNATTANSWTFSSGTGAGTYEYTLLVDANDADNTSVNVTVNADDAAGNSATPVTNTGAFAIDNTEPTVTIDDPTAAAEVNSSKVIDFTENDGSGCGTMLTQASVNGGTNWTTITTGVSTLGDIAEFGPLNDGAVTLTLRTTDGAGNVSSPVTTVALVKDATPPTVSAVTPSDQEISIADNGNPFSIDIDFNEGMDQSTAPVVTITSNNTLPTTNTGGSWTDSDTYNATFGNIDVSTAEAIEDLDVVVSGAKDDTEDDGNEMLEDNTSGLDNFSIDTEAPTISFDGTSPAADDCVRGIETVEFTAADASAFSGLDEVRAKINFDDDYEVVTSGFALEDLQAWDSLSQGTFTLYLLALDDFGNTTEITRDLNKDDVAPIISALTVTPSCVTTDDVVTITFSVEEEGCGTFNADDIELTIDDSGFGPEAIYEPTVNLTGGTGTNGDPYTFSATFTILTSHIDGEYLVTVTATDDAGNSDSDDETFDVDQTPPTLSNLVTSSVPGGSPTTVGGSAPNRELTIAFDEVTDGCANFDNGTITYIITGPGNTALTVSPAAPTKSVDTWTTTVTVPSNEPSGNYQIIIIAADDNGNADTLDPAGVEFVIDNTPPQVSSVTTSHTPAGPFPPAPVLNRADDDATPPEFYIDVVYNEALDAGQAIPTLEFHIPGKNPTSPVAALTLGVASRPNANTLRYPYDLDNTTNIDMRTIGVRINGLNDVVGNTQTVANTKGSLFGIDFQTPQLNSVTPTPNFIVDGSSQLGLLFSFSEDMKTDVKPVVSFDAGNGPDNDSLALVLTYNGPQSIWNSAQLFTAKFDVDGSHPLDSDPIAVGLTVATDLAGNPFPGSNESGVFIVDTKEPTCVSLTTDPVDPVVNLGDLDFTVTVVMDQTLDNGVTPTITFATSSAFSVSGGAYSTTTNTDDTYTFTVTHNGTTEEEHEEIMSITGFEDLAGNPQVIACLDTFDVDTDKPDIVSVTVSDDKLCSDDHNDAFSITVVFDEEMDGVTAPSITLSPDHSSVFTGTGGSWSQTTVNNDTYTFTATLDLSAEIEVDDVDIQLSGAKDLLGNLMLADLTSGADKFSIDTKAPEVTSVAFNPSPSNIYGVNRSTIGANGFAVVVTYDEAMDDNSTPTIVFDDLSQGGTGTPGAALTTGSGSWSTVTYTNDTYTQNYTVNDAAVELESITVDVTSATDLCGNTQDSFDGSLDEGLDFAIDLIAPTCSSITANTDPLNEGNLVQDLAIFFTEDMDPSVLPKVKFATSTNFTFVNGSWDDDHVYDLEYLHNGTEEEIPIEIVSLDLVSSQPIDLMGNPIESSSCTDQFKIDTKKPLVESVTFTPTKVIGTTTTFSVDVEFNEAMENVVIPTLSFSAGSGAFALQLSSDWINGTHYIFDYVVTDNNIEETDVTVTINGAEDNAGNVMLAHVSTETFDIDQVAPTIDGLSVSDALINKAEANDGGYTFVVTATFSEEMNPAANPSIQFAPDVTTGTTSLTLSGVPTWNLGYTEVEWTYLALDASVALEGLEITITGGEDACGNATDYTAPKTGVFDEIFSIDTENPTIIFGQSTPLAESCVNGTEDIDFSANDGSGFSGIDEVQARIGAASFAAFTSGSDLSSVSGWGTASDGPITIELKALDLAGNETVISRNFTKDATAPVISNVQFTNTCVTTGDVVTLTFDIAENGCGTFDSDDITITGFTNSFIADGGNPIGSGTYTFTLLIDGDDTEGSKSVTINASDASGNAATPSVNNNAFTIDKSAPTYSLFGSPSPSCANSSDVITLLITSEDIIFSCGPYGVSNITASTSLGAANVTTFGAPLYLISVDLSGTDNTDDGIYDIDIVMTDAAGNVRNETITNAFTIDNTAPVVSNVTVTPGCENGGDVVTLTFDVVENGCGTFNQNDITINDNVATNNAWTYVSGSGSGTYEYTLLIDITDPDGAVDVSVDATDDAGNSSTGNDSGDTDFTIDNSAPVVAFTNPTSGATVNSSKVLNFTATDGAGCGITSTEVSVDNTNWFAASSGVTELGDITQFAGLSDGGFTLYIRSTDVPGNIGTSSIALVKDATAPEVSSVTVSHPIINIADDGEEFTVTVVYNEGMDTSIDPSVNISVINALPDAAVSGNWTNSTTFVASFGLIDVSTPETVSDLDISILNSYDDTEDDGNVLGLEVEADAFDIDTEAPTCFDITNNNADIYENDLSVTVSVQFTEDMATSPNPTFLITGTTELTPGASNWSGDTFTQTFTHTGVEEETSAKFEIDGFAALPTDLAGNPVSAVLCSTDVDIDTRKPLVTSVVFSTSLITESTTSLDVTVNFDEDMSTPPTIEFNTLLPGLLTYNSVSSTSTSFTYNYSVADANLDLDDITVDVAIGEDVAGNVMLTHTSTESFDIDQVAPTITDASIKSSNSIDDQYARVGHDIILTLTPSEELNTSSFSGNIAGYSINSISDQFGLNGTYILTVSTDPGVSAGLVTFSIDYEDINGNAGATLTSVTDASSVTVDKTAPVGTIDLAGGQADPTSDSPINFALTFSEDVYGLTDSDIDVSGTAGATTATVTTINASTYNVAVTGMTGSGTVVINLANGKVTDIAANGNVNTVLTDNSVQYDVSGATDVASGAGVEPATLSSLVDTQGEAVLNFDFAVTDDGVVPAADLLATLITDISVSQGTGNDFGDWTTILAGAELTDGTNTVSGTVGATTIAFTGLAHGAGQIGEVADNATKTYTLKVWLSDTPTGVIDNMNLAFKVNRSSFTVDGAGSSFAGGAGTDIESGSTNNAIDVDATELTFTTTPANTEINTNTTFVIDATDENGNRDVDYGPTTVTLTANQSTISSGGSGTLASGTLTLNTVQFSTAFANDYVTAAGGALTDGVSDNFNIKEEEPSAITNLSVVNSSTSFALSWTNPDSKNTLILAKKTNSSFAYSDEAGMDNETGWPASSTVFGNAASPADNDVYVIYTGASTSVTMTNLQNNYTLYSVSAYAYAGGINSGVQNFNTNEASVVSFTYPKEVDFSKDIKNGLSLGIDNITPQPASLNNVVSIEVETIEDMPLTLELYDSKGQKMMTLFEGRDFSAGETPFEFNLANTISSGQHFLRLTGNGHVVIAPIMIVK